MNPLDPFNKSLSFTKLNDDGTYRCSSCNTILSGLNIYCESCKIDGPKETKLISILTDIAFWFLVGIIFVILLYIVNI